MMNNTASPTTTPAGQPASSANAGQTTEATVPALDTPMPLSGSSQQFRDTCYNCSCRVTSQRHVAEVCGESHRQGRAVASVSTYLHVIRARHPPAQPVQDGEPGERAQWHQCDIRARHVTHCVNGEHRWSDWYAC
eukprot:3801727-Pyramimonas_sp.AAC.1